MTKSEAIRIISDQLGVEIEYAEVVLGIVEKIGMVPPIIKEQSWQMLPSGEMVYAVHEWEEE